MKNPVMKSNAPLFVSFGADPNYCDTATCAMTKEQMMEHIASSADFATGYENGEIVCALVPIDYKCYGEGGKPAFGGVKTESMIEMLKLQSDIANGIKPKYSEPKPETASKTDVPSAPTEPEKLPEHIGLDKVDEILNEKGYTTPGMKKWDADAITYWVFYEKGEMDGSVAGPCGSYYPMKPVNNPIWGQEGDYEPMFLTAQVEAIPSC